MTEKTAVEIALIKSEVNRTEAEGLKLVRESELLKKQMSQKWFSANKPFVELIIGAVVAGVLTFNFTVNYMQPEYDKKLELINIENKIKTANIQYEIDVTERANAVLAQQTEEEKNKREHYELIIKDFELKIQDFEKENDEYEQRVNIDAKKYKLLQQHLHEQNLAIDAMAKEGQVNASNVTKLLGFVASNKARSEDLGKELKSVQVIQTDAKSRSQYLRKTMANTAFGGTYWRVDRNKSYAKKYFILLNVDGRVAYTKFKEGIYDYDRSPAKWLITDGNLVISWENGEGDEYVIDDLHSKQYKGVDPDGQVRTISRVENS